MKNQGDLKAIIEILNEIKEDETLAKNTKQKLKTTICVLEDCKDVTVTIDKTIQEIETIVEDPNLPIYVKTQLWNIVTILESKI